MTTWNDGGVCFGNLRRVEIETSQLSRKADCKGFEWIWILPVRCQMAARSYHSSLVGDL